MIASTFVGIVVGLFAEKLNVNEGEFSKKDVVTYAIANVIAHAVAWIGVAPVLDILIMPSRWTRFLRRARWRRSPTF